MFKLIRSLFNRFRKKKPEPTPAPAPDFPPELKPSEPPKDLSWFLEKKKLENYVPKWYETYAGLRPYPTRYAIDDSGLHFDAGTTTAVIAQHLWDVGRETESLAILEGLVSTGYFVLGFWVPLSSELTTFTTTDHKLAERWQGTRYLILSGFVLELFVVPILYSHKNEYLANDKGKDTVGKVHRDWKEPTPDQLQKDRDYIMLYLEHEADAETVAKLKKS